MTVLAIVGLFIWSQKHLTNTYAISPGLAQPVGPLISVSGEPHHTARKTILLTDVYLTQLTEWQWLIDRIHPPAHTEFVDGGMLAGPDVPTSELYTQAYLQMYDSQNYAKVAAMRALHMTVTGHDVGATVAAVATNAPVGQAVSVADRIVWARGGSVTSPCGFLDALAGAIPGRAVALKVEHAHIATDGTITGYSPPRLLHVHTSAPPPGQGTTGCPGHEHETAWLGVGLESAVQWHFPISVSINTANIGGPSAGLAMTLGIIDAVSTTPLTGHLKIAATGTIDPSGNVGDVGGVAEKTIAVENAGATVFLVPPQELGVARKAASSSLTVIAVATLGQALDAIHRLGGSTPALISG